MIVDNIRLEEQAEYCQLTARVRREFGPAWENDLWFRFPRTLGPRLVTGGDAFLAALLLPSMLGDKRLQIEGTVSPELLAASTQIQEIYAAWVKGARPVAIETGTSRVSSPPSGRGTGSFFSGGVDSWHTLLKHVEPITHLLLVEKFDSKLLHSAAACDETRKELTRVAAGLGKELVILATNARTLFVPSVRWEDYHGAVLIALGLGMGHVLQKVYVPATRTYQYLEPWGSHPLLDPLWSTELTRIIHDGAEATRGQKTIHWICRSELALQSLRVCLAPGDEYNCGRCEKCLRTMIALYLGDSLGKSTAFPPTLPLPAVAQLIYPSEAHLHFALEHLALLEAKSEKSSFDRQLKQALETGVRLSRREIARRERKQRRKLRPPPGRLAGLLRRLTGR